jgi:glycosyltransferase involved in cell wall biosynthesis
MAKPSISILIPCYNGEKYIDKCLQSAIDQTYDKSLYEIIVCNDGSKDNSLQILRQYEAKYPDLIKIITQENKGISFVRAALLEKAKNHYIYMIDVDD